MVDLDRFTEMADEIIEDIPEEYFRDLNGGVNIRPELKRHPESINDDLFILGEYHRSPVLGRIIYIYHGSFGALYGDLPETLLIKRLRTTILHELRHHLESLAGERDLEIEDAVQIHQYKMRNAGKL